MESDFPVFLADGDNNDEIDWPSVVDHSSDCAIGFVDSIYGSNNDSIGEGEIIANLTSIIQGVAKSIVLILDEGSAIQGSDIAGEVIVLRLERTAIESQVLENTTVYEFCNCKRNRSKTLFSFPSQSIVPTLKIGRVSMCSG